MARRVVAVVVAASAAIAGLAVLPVSPAGADPTGSRYVSVTPERLWDSVNTQPFSSGSTQTVSVTGEVGVDGTGPVIVPAGATAVALSVTVVPGDTANGHLRVYPADEALPDAAAINWDDQETTTNSVVVKLPTSGAAAGDVKVYNHVGSARVILEVTGFFELDAAGSFYAVSPSRIFDTATSGSDHLSGFHDEIDVALTGQAGVPNDEASSVVVSVTSVPLANIPSQGSYLTVYERGTTRPTVASQSVTAGETNTTTLTVPVDGDGYATVYSHRGDVRLIVDVVGFYTDVDGGIVYQPVTPLRVLETRSTFTDGRITGFDRLAAQETVTVPLDVHAGDVLDDAAGTPTAVLLNVAAANSAGPSAYLTVWETGTSRPTVATVSYNDQYAVANSVIVPIDASSPSVNVYAHRATDVVIDFYGYFEDTRTDTAPAGRAPDDGQRVFDRPDVSAIYDDPDGTSSGTLEFEFSDLSGAVVETTTTGSLDQGEQGTVTVPSSLVEGTYRWRVRSNDGTTNSDWSSSWVVSWIEAPPEGGASTGARDFYEFESFDLSTTEQLQVNLGNGNVVYSATDLSMAGTGFDQFAGRVHNSQTPGFGPFGAGWQTNDGWGIALATADSDADGQLDQAVYQGSSGERFEFTWTGAAWSPPAEEPNLELTEDSDGSFELRFEQAKVDLRFDEDGYLTSRIDRNDNESTYTYTADRLPDTIVDTRGRTISYDDTDSDGLIDTVAAPDGDGGTRTWSHNYVSGSLATVTDPEGFTTGYDYDSSGALTQIDVGAGPGDDHTTAISYATGGDGQVETVTRALGMLGTTGGDPADSTWTFSYIDSDEHPSSGTDVCTHPDQGFSADNACSYVDDPRGGRTFYELDGDDTGTAETNEDNGKVITVIDQRGHETSRSYTPSSNVADLTPAGASDPYSTTYNSDDLPDSVTAPTGNETSMQYSGSDSFLLDAVANPQGEDQGFGYDGAGNTTSLHAGTLNASDPDGDEGSELDKFYDLHRRTDDNTTTADGGEAHDGRIDQVEATDGGFITEYVYGDETDEICTGSGVKDADPDLDCIKHPVLGEESFDHDALGRMVSYTDGLGNHTSYEHDDLDRLIEVEYTPAGSSSVSRTVSFDYDGAGNRISRTDETGTIGYDYDTQNRLIEEDRTQTVGADVTYDYDLSGNLRSYDDAGGTVTYDYDATNNVCWAHVGATTSSGCGSAPSGETFEFDYDDANRRTRIDYPNAVDTFVDYDDSGRATEIKTGVEGSALADGFDSLVFHETYDHSLASVDTAVLRSLTDHLTGETTSYGYTNKQQLEYADTDDAGGNVRRFDYTYDGRGNRRSRAVEGGATEYFTYNGDNQLCWSHTTDGTCGTTPSGATTYTYDAAGNMTVIDAPGTTGDLAFGYDEQGHQCWTNPNAAASGSCSSLPSGSTDYSYAGLGQTERTEAGDDTFTNTALGISVVDGQGNDDYEWTRLPDGTLLSQRGGSGNVNIHTDRLGSIRLVTNASNNIVEERSYSPYGEQNTGSTGWTVPYGFAGQYRDQVTGHYKMGERYYRPQTGTWTQSDPSRLERNTYLYAGGNSVNNVDPRGTSFFGIDCPLGQYNDGGCVGGSVNDAKFIEGKAFGVAVNFFVSSLCTAIVGGVSGGTLLAPGAPYCIAAGSASGALAGRYYEENLYDS